MDFLAILAFGLIGVAIIITCYNVKKGSFTSPNNGKPTQENKS